MKKARHQPAVKPTKSAGHAKRTTRNTPKRVSTAPAATPETTTVEVNDDQRGVGFGYEATVLEPNVHRDTTGMFRVAYHYPQHIKELVLKWISSNCPVTYNKPLQTMWLKGVNQWTRGLPCPQPRVVNYWVRLERAKLAESVDEHIPDKQSLRKYFQVACQAKQESMGASSDVLTPTKTQNKAMKVAINTVLRFILDSDPEPEQHILNIMLVSKQMHTIVAGAAVFPAFMASMRKQMDLRRLLYEYEFSQRLAATRTEPPRALESEKKVPVLFPNISDAAAKLHLELLYLEMRLG